MRARRLWVGLGAVVVLCALFVAFWLAGGRYDPIANQIDRLATGYGLSPTDPDQLSAIESELGLDPQMAWTGPFVDSDRLEKDLERIAGAYQIASRHFADSSTTHIQEWNFFGGGGDGSDYAFRAVVTSDKEGRRRLTIVYAREYVPMWQRIANAVGVGR